MSIREMVGRLTDAKNQIAQVSTVGGHCANAVTEAAELVRTVLDGVDDKSLPEAIAGQGKAIGDAFSGVLALTAGVDKTVRNLQSVGTSGGRS